MSALEWVWGVDVGEAKVALAWTDGTRRDSVAIDVGTVRGAERMSTLRTATMEMVSTVRIPFPPLIVWIEQPVGRMPAPHLGFATGTVLCALHDALHGTAPHPISVILTTPPEWKKAVGLKGNCGKPEIMKWARGLGYRGGDQDQADALVIAQAGRIMTT